MEDFSSPIRDFEESEKQREALAYAGLKIEEIDNVIKEAQARYDRMQKLGSRPLRTLKSVYKSLDAMDEYFENLDMSKTDRQGKLLNDPASVIGSVKKLEEMYTSVKNFEKSVDEDLKQANTGIRGPNSVLGDNEGEQRKKFSEADIAEGSLRVMEKSKKSENAFTKLLDFTQDMEDTEKARQETVADLFKPDMNNEPSGYLEN